jgi:ubiquinone biosynthesis protein
VHTATLPSGDQVVVKVRRPGVTGVVGSDLDIVQRLAIRLQRSTRWGRSAGAVDLAQGFAAALREELDLRIEARNMAAVATATAARDGDVRVPTPYQPYCGERVLVMQHLDGRPLLTAAPGLPAESRAALARDQLDSLLGQVMLDGIFHADPHPGNILLLHDGHLGLLDWGSVGRIDAGLRGALQRLLLALDRGDPVMLTDALLDVVDRPE